jgi:hypothetical protein
VTTLQSSVRAFIVERMSIHALVQPLAREQQGFVTWRDLRALGLRPNRIVRAVRRGELVRRGRGVYALPETQLEPNLHAVAKAHRGAVSHDTAAMWWGMELAHTPDRRHLTVPRNRGRLRDAISAWRLHRAGLTSADQVMRHGLCVTTPLRTVLDCARLLPLAHAVVIADSAVRKRLVRWSELQAVVETLPPGPGRRKVQRVVSAVDPKCGSVLESLLRVLLWENGLLPPESQYVFVDAAQRFVGYLDFAWPALRLAVEAEGFEFHSQRAEHRRDCQRHNALAGRGWWLLRFTWEDVVLRPDEVIATVRETLETLAELVVTGTSSTQREASTTSSPLVASGVA